AQRDERGPAPHSSVRASAASWPGSIAAPAGTSATRRPLASTTHTAVVWTLGPSPLGWGAVNHAFHTGASWARRPIKKWKLAGSWWRVSELRTAAGVSRSGWTLIATTAPLRA